MKKITVSVLTAMMVWGVCTANMNVYANETTERTQEVVKSELDVAQTKYDESKANFDELEKQRQELQAKVDKFTAMKEEASNNITKLRNELEQKQAELDTLNDQILVLENALDYNPSQIESIQDEIAEAIENGMDPSDPDILEAQNYLNFLQEQLAYAQANLNSLQQNYAVLKQNIHDLELAFEENKDTSAYSGKNREEYIYKLSLLKPAYDEAKAQMEKDKAILDALTEEYKSFTPKEDIKVEEPKKEEVKKEETKKEVTKQEAKKETGAVHTGYNSYINLFTNMTLLAGLGTVVARFKKKEVK